MCGQTQKGRADDGGGQKLLAHLFFNLFIFVGEFFKPREANFPSHRRGAHKPPGVS